MTLWVVLSWSIVRALVVATLAMWFSRGLFRQIQSVATTGMRHSWLIATLIPLIVPELIIGFTYRLAAQQVTHSLIATECLYGVLLLIRATSIGILVRIILPTCSVSDESLHMWQLMRSRCLRGWRITWWKLLITGPWRTDLVAWCLAALAVFQDFETAALIQVDRHPVAWSVWLFDANAGNQRLDHSLRMLIAPLIFQLLLLVPGLWLVTRRNSHMDQCSPARSTERHLSPWMGMTGTLVAFSLVAVWPLIIAIPGLRSGWPLLLNEPIGLLKQQTASLAFSTAASIVALLIAVMLHRRGRPFLTVACLLPGLCGSLILSLLLLAFFQWPGVRVLWDTWFPMLIGQSLLLLPRAFLLIVVLGAQNSVESRYSARLLLNGTTEQRRLSRQIQWRMEHLLCGFLLIHWCSWDVTTASILRPVSVEPVVTRLYREMHFSRTETLTTLTLITALCPILTLLVAGGIWRTSWRRFS